jgi:hypothetical protein
MIRVGMLLVFGKKAHPVRHSQPKLLSEYCVTNDCFLFSIIDINSSSNTMGSK